MLNDPLLNQPWGPPTGEASTMATPTSRVAHPAGHARVTSAKRAKHPAASSRILAVGMSVAAVIGMSAAYTKAQRIQTSQPENFDSGTNNQLNLTPAAPAQQQPVEQQPSTPAPVAPQPNIQQQQNHVVQIPVPQAAPATGGYVPQNQAPAQRQQSNGSN